jgi:CheY-like chemotaxis protein
LDRETLKRTLRQVIRERSGDARDLREVVLSVDCRGRDPGEILGELRPALTRVDVVRRGLVIFLKNLPSLAHSLRGFAERLSLEVARAGVRAYLVEPSGLTSVLLDPLGEVGPLVIFAPRERGRRVLLVERRASSADFLTALLESAGHEVVRAAGAANLEDLLRERAFDVLLLDATAAPLALRAMETSERRPEIVALTSSDEGAKGIPARTVLRKPFGARDLLRAISPLEPCPPG